VPWLVPVTHSVSGLRDKLVEVFGLHVFAFIGLLAVLL